MGFLRQNVFLLAVIGAVVIAGGVMVTMYFSVASASDELVSERTKLSKQLKQTSQPPNAAMVSAVRGRADGIVAAVKGIADQSDQWNRRTFRVMPLPIPNKEGDVVEKVDAFPIDRGKYPPFLLNSVFTRQYGQELKAMLGTLKPTNPPTQQEIDQQVAQAERKLAFEQAAREKREARKSGAPGLPRQTPRARAAPSYRDTDIPEDVLEEMMAEEAYRGPRGGRRRRTRTSGRRFGSALANASAEAKEKAFQLIRAKKAKGGRIYATMDSLDPVFLGERVTASDGELWRAQLNLWVTKEILEVIRQTNQQVLEMLPESDRNVLNSPVKRLVQLEVNENYYTGGTPVFETSEGRTRRRSSGGEGSPGDIGEEERGWTGKRRRWQPKEAQAGKAVASAAPTLTQRMCNKTYDVIHYRFSLVMPTRYLPLLETNLLARNNHTILSVEFEQAESSLATADRGRQASDGEFYYYGADPVVQVTVVGEQLFLASWVRGVWDEKANEWSQPPLMPQEVLQALSIAAPGAIRNEDKKRLSAAYSGW